MRRLISGAEAARPKMKSAVPSSEAGELPVAAADVAATRFNVGPPARPVEMDVSEVDIVVRPFSGAARAGAALLRARHGPPAAAPVTAGSHAAGRRLEGRAEPGAQHAPALPYALLSSSFAHALVRDAPCALADSRADKLDEEHALLVRVARRSRLPESLLKLAASKSAELEEIHTLHLAHLLAATKSADDARALSVKILAHAQCLRC